ncbi:MAG: hypothetical protein AAF639_02295 [Chloroflexota bacterium]
MRNQTFGRCPEKLRCAQIINGHLPKVLPHKSSNSPFSPQPQTITIGEGETLNIGEIRLQGPQVTGRFLDPDGTPMGNVAVTALSVYPSGELGKGSLVQ